MATNQTLKDAMRPLDLKHVKCGWYESREYDYWVPEADIQGKIPTELYGTFFRNGPGLLEVYGKKLKHPIDGDGMIVALSFIAGRVHLRTRFVASKHRLHEEHEKKYLYRGQMGTHPNGVIVDTANLLKSLLMMRWPKLRYRNPSNTNVFYWGGKVLSVYETKLPYCLDPHTLETIGLETFNGATTLNMMAAHFRLDMIKKHLVWIGVQPEARGRKPSLAIYEFDEKWNVVQYQMHHIDGLNYAHDFLLLPDYYVFHMTPFAKMSLKGALLVYCGISSPGELMQYYPDLPSRFVIIPRRSDATSLDIKMVDTEPFHIFHYGNSEQKGTHVIEFNAVCLGPKFNMEFENEIWLSNASVAPGQIYSFKIDLETNTCERSAQPEDPASVEFPTTHPYRHSLPNTRYCYLMASARKGHNLPYRDVIKHDMQREDRQVWYSHGVVGEPVFVPRLGWKSCEMGAEDDGYVLVQLFVPETCCTEFVILDARDVSKGPLARIRLKHHIPYGFHGTFTPEVFIDAHHIVSAKM